MRSIQPLLSYPWYKSYLLTKAQGRHQDGLSMFLFHAGSQKKS